MPRGPSNGPTLALERPRRRVRVKWHRPGAVGAIGVLVVLAASCLQTGRKSPAELLDEAVLRHAEGLRWQRCAQASAVVPPALRDAFAERCERHAARVRIVDYEIRKMVVAPDGRHADVEVVFGWHRVASTTIRRTRIQQRWHRVDDVWWLVGRQPLPDPNGRPPPVDLPF